MKLQVDEEFSTQIPPLTDEEFAQLEENILSDGEIISPIITWNGFIVDGHNRYRILQEHPEIPYKTFEMEFPDRYAVLAWICHNQLGRRNLTEEQKKYLIGKQYNSEKKSDFRGNQYTSPDESACPPKGDKQNGRQKRTWERVAEENHVGKSMCITPGAMQMVLMLLMKSTPVSVRIFYPARLHPPQRMSRKSLTLNWRNARRWSDGSV